MIREKVILFGSLYFVQDQKAVDSLLQVMQLFLYAARHF